MTNNPRAPMGQILEIDPGSQTYFDGAKAGEFMLLRCTACQTWHAPQAVVCWNCSGGHLAWAKASGKGTVHTFSVVHRVTTPGFTPPYNIVMVELAEGPRVLSQIVDAPNEAIEIGLPVRAVFREFESGEVIPFFTID